MNLGGTGKKKEGRRGLFGRRAKPEPSANGASTSANGARNGAVPSKGTARNGASKGANGVRNGARKPVPIRGLGRPRTPPVGDIKVMSFDEAAQIGPEIKRIYRWAPRCKVCGDAMRGLEVTAPAEGPDRNEFPMAVSAILCPSCRNANFLTGQTSWVVVSGPLPVNG